MVPQRLENLEGTYQMSYAKDVLTVNQNAHESGAESQMIEFCNVYVLLACREQMEVIFLKEFFFGWQKGSACKVVE